MCSKKFRARVLNNFGDVNITVPPWSHKSMHDDSSIGPAKISALCVCKNSSLSTGFSLLP